MEILMDYSWPGNVKELENSIQHAFLLTEGEVIERELLPSRILHEVLTEKNEGITSFEENEKRFLMKILHECNWNKLQVAKQLNVSRSTLYSKLKKYNLTSKQ
jgi:two-component system response regulator HydG